MRALFLLALLCSSCLSAKTAPGEEAGVALASQPVATEATKKKPNVDFDALEYAVDAAERRVSEAEFTGIIKTRESEAKVHDAELALERATAELEHLEAYTIPRRLAQEDLGLDRSRGRLADAEAELQQMRDMYKDEEFATSTKELVITRSERNVDQQKRSLALAEAARADLEAFELAQDLADAQRKVEDAKFKLELAKMHHDETLGSLHSKALDAAESLRKARRSLAEAREKVEA